MKGIIEKELKRIDDPTPFNLLDDLVIITDVSNFKVLFLNDYGKKMIHNIDYTDKTCYQILSKNKDVCPNCLIKRMNSSRMFRGVNYNNVLNKMLLLEDRFIVYKGITARLEIAKDISQDYMKNKIINKSLQSERLINTVSNMFINSDGFDDSLKEALMTVGTFFSADRAYVYRIENNMLNIECDWASKEEFYQNELLSLPISSVTYWMDSLSNKKCIIYNDIEKIKDLRPKEYALYKRIGIKSLVAVPIFVNSEIIGFVGLDNPKIEKLANIANILQSISNVIALGFLSEQRRIAIEYDEITNLPNFEFFKRDVMAYLQSHQDENFYLVMFDINRFELINSYYGINFGNDVLLKISKFLTSNVHSIIYASRIRSSDTFYVFGRLDKDEPNYLTKRIKAHLSAETDVFGSAKITFAFGYLYLKAPRVNEDFYTLVDKLSLAHNEAKKLGDNTICQYSDKLREEEMREQEIVNIFKEAIDKEEFKLYIQPIYNVDTLTIASGEVLVRWLRHGVTIPPGEFIPVLEKNGMISVLDNYIFCHTLKIIRSELDKGNEVVPLSVNLSRVTIINEEKLVSSILNYVDEYKIPKGLIEIEITESAFVEREAFITKFIEAMRENGIPILMDDFGSGYSSLNSFKDLDISILKLDYKFLAKGGNEFKKAKTIESVVNLTRSLNIPIIAEGVEKQEEADFLKMLGVKIIQGYLYAKPMPYEDFLKLSKDTPKFKQIDFESSIYKDLIKVDSPLNTFLSITLTTVGIYNYENGVMTLMYKNKHLSDVLKKIGDDEHHVKNIKAMNDNLSKEDEDKINKYFEEVANNTAKEEYVDYSYKVGKYFFKIRAKATLLSKTDTQAVILVETIRTD